MQSLPESRISDKKEKETYRSKRTRRSRELRERHVRRVLKLRERGEANNDHAGKRSQKDKGEILRKRTEAEKGQIDLFNEKPSK